MTTTADHATFEMPEVIREGAVRLIRDLAAIAGDDSAVYERIRQECRSHKPDDALGGLAAALIVTFTECITTPTEPGAYSPVAYPLTDQEPDND